MTPRSFSLHNARPLKLLGRTAVRFLIGVVGAPWMMQVAACAATSNGPPEGGQTGSPAVPPDLPEIPPDHESPIRFRPDPPPDNPGGPVPAYPESSSYPARRVQAARGAVYVADPARGLLVFDAAEPAAPQLVHERQLPGGARWLTIDGDMLTIVAGGTADMLSFESAAPTTRVVTLDLGADALEPTLVGEHSVAGTFREAHATEGRLVLLTSTLPDVMCHPQVGFRESWAATLEMVVSDFSLSAAGPDLTDQVVLPGEGYYASDNAIVVTRGWVSSTPGTVTAVDVSSPGQLEVLPKITVEGLLRSGPVRYSSGELVFLSMDGGNVVLDRVRFDGNEIAEQQTLQVLGSPTAGIAFDIYGDIGEHFALLVSGEQPGVVIDLDAPNGPVIVEQLPPQITFVTRAGDAWLALGGGEAFALTLDESGHVTLSEPVTVPFLTDPGRYVPPMLWVEEQERFVFPYNEAGVEGGRIGALLISEGQVEWLAGVTTEGSALVPSYDGGPDSLDVFVGDVQSYAITRDQAIFEPGTINAALQPFQLEASAAQAVSLGELPIAVELVADHEVSLALNLNGAPRLAFYALTASGTDTSIALDYRADRLARVGNDVLAYSLNYSNGCYSGDLGTPMPDGGEACTNIGRPAIAHVSLAQEPVLVRQVELPNLEMTLAADTSLNWEWSEFVAQGQAVGLIQHRGYRCRSVAACEALDTDYEVITDNGGTPMCEEPGCDQQPVPPTLDTVRGYRDEQWFYAFDTERGQFNEPVQLGHAKGYAYITAGGIVSRDSALLNLFEFTPLAVNPDGVHVDHGRIELLRVDVSSDEDPLEHITLAGFPLLVDDDHVVTIQPASVLGDSSEAVPVELRLLQLYEGRAYIQQTLGLGVGHSGHRWASDRGYVLLKADDLCAKPVTEVVAIERRDNELVELDRLELDGTAWQIVTASDERLVVYRGRNTAQYANIGLNRGQLLSPEFTTVPNPVPVAADNDRIIIGDEARRPPL